MSAKSSAFVISNIKITVNPNNPDQDFISFEYRVGFCCDPDFTNKSETEVKNYLYEWFRNSKVYTNIYEAFQARDIIQARVEELHPLEIAPGSAAFKFEFPSVKPVFECDWNEVSL